MRLKGRLRAAAALRAALCTALIAAPLDASLAAPALAAEADPFRMLNLSPTVAIFGLPAWTTPAPHGGRIALVGDVGNDFRFSRRGEERYYVDAETSRASFAFERGFAGAWSAGIEIPFVQISGGVLDDTIDAWHSAFGMPDGGRNRRPEDQVFVRLGAQGGDLVRIERNERGLGDIRLSGGRVLGPRDAPFFLRAVLKLPTGDEDILAGSGAADFALTVQRSRRFDARPRPLGFYWGMGVAVLGDAKRVRYSQETQSYLGMVGGSIRLFPRMGLKVQVDAHSRLFDSPLEELGATAVQIGIGGYRDLGKGRSLEFAVEEDLNVGTAPDVALHVGFDWAL
jgi:hypothetical protein